MVELEIPSGCLLHSHGKWPIEIDGLPIRNWWMAMLNNQMVIPLYLG
jgi:hypothetical protein